MTRTGYMEAFILRLDTFYPSPDRRRARPSTAALLPALRSGLYSIIIRLRTHRIKLFFSVEAFIKANVFYFLGLAESTLFNHFRFHTPSVWIAYMDGVSFYLLHH
jgi:hypothetical protein